MVSAYYNKGRDSPIQQCGLHSLLILPRINYGPSIQLYRGGFFRQIATCLVIEALGCNAYSDRSVEVLPVGQVIARPGKNK